MAVENDYNALVFRLNDLTEELLRLKVEVDNRLLEEKRDGLEPNATHWVNLTLQRTLLLSGLFDSLSKQAGMVLKSRPGEAVFTEQPPPPPDAPETG